MRVIFNGEFRVLAMDVIVSKTADLSRVWIALQIRTLESEQARFEIADCHISIGTFDCRADPTLKKINTEQKAAEKLQLLIDVAELLAHHCLRRQAHVGIVPNTRLPFEIGKPSVFNLLVCHSSGSIDRLCVKVQDAFAGRFKTLGKCRTMMYQEGPTFHLSVYSNVHLLSLV